MLTEERILIDKLRRIEALFAGTNFEGERNAAANAMDRIRSRLDATRESDPPIEYRFGALDAWSKKLLTALLRRYGLKPYRYRGQRRTTVMTRVPRSFVDQTLWPEFLRLDETLREYLREVTDRVIATGIHADSSDAEVRSEAARLPAGSD